MSASSLLRRILVLNAGSSSLKYGLFAAIGGKIDEVAMATGLIERIGDDYQLVTHRNTGEEKSLKLRETSCHDHHNALLCALSLLGGDEVIGDISAVGHRVVHGGVNLTAAQLCQPSVVQAIRDAIPLAPLHNTANLLGIETAMQVFPELTPNVAVFDTAFHSSMPPSSYLYAVPRNLHDDHGVRRYGFHGISHQFVAKQAANYLGKSISDVNLITCHLGAGSSMCCIKKGKSVDTTMGMTPLDGLVMATRCGDIDAGVVFHLSRHLHMNVAEIEEMLQTRSGWLALAGCRDARSVEDGAERGEAIMVETMECIAHRIRNYLGAYYWHLSGDVDAVVFTAGVGENCPPLRRMCLAGAERMGFEIDTERNASAVRQSAAVCEVSAEGSERKVLVVRTNEELSIAEQTLALL